MLAHLDQLRMVVIGLGYVGLPLAVEFAKVADVVGFDVNPERVAALKQYRDVTNEVSSEQLAKASRLTVTTSPEDLKEANFYIVTVPTPIDEHKQPDLRPLLAASTTVGHVLQHGDIVVFESTVFPGATEEVCVPALERVSGLKFNHDFFVGYSPERINPGDKSHRLPDIRKVTSGSTPAVATLVDAAYQRIITAGTHMAPSIRVAEAAKVIENTQRDLNIALINELAIIFNRMGIDTEAVLEAAGTKWNFLPFRPGLVGGHCIGVDPYYLTHKAQEVGHHPMLILAGRQINDNMGAYVAGRMARALIGSKIHMLESRILVMGFAFKENCPDYRNSKVVDVINELQEYGASVDVYDPWIDATAAAQEYSYTFVNHLQPAAYDGIVVAVAHDEFRHMGASGMRALGKVNHVLYDLKYIMPEPESDLRF